MALTKELLKSLKLPFSKKSNKKSSNLQALERLKEIHNYDYTTFVANSYRAQNLTVWEYSKERNLVNHPLNLIIKREKDILLIQCRSHIKKVTLDELIEFENVGAEFTAQHPPFKRYNILYLYICSEDKFSSEALKYMKNNSHISYDILKEHQ